MTADAASAVEIGTAIVSYIEPHPGCAVAFNRWYERDHFPATVKAGPGVFATARFVATRACKDARPQSGRLLGDPARGSYLAVAWLLAGKQDEWDEWVGREMQTLTAQGRLFAGRDHIHTAVYRYVSQSGAIDAIVALDRAPPARSSSPTRRAPAFPISGPPASRPSVVLRLERTIISEAQPPPHDLVFGFGAVDPVAAFGRIAGDADRCGFASPFLATIPGTDTYADDL